MFSEPLKTARAWGVKEICIERPSVKTGRNNSDEKDGSLPRRESERGGEKERKGWWKEREKGEKGGACG
jgi:hypothetical protein